MKVTLCDRCGAKIPGSENIGHIAIRYESHKEGAGKFADWDICLACMEKIERYIKVPYTTPSDIPADKAFAETLEEPAEPDIESEDEPISEAEEEPKGQSKSHGRRPTIDWGKFKACVDAGRDNEWLAIEFGVDPERIPKWRWLLKDKIKKGEIK